MKAPSTAEDKATGSFGGAAHYGSSLYAGEVVTVRITYEKSGLRCRPEPILRIQEKAVDETSLQPRLVLLSAEHRYVAAAVFVEPELGSYPHGPLAVGNDAGHTWL